MTQQKIEDRLSLILSRQMRICNKYTMDNDKARSLIIRMSFEYAALRNQLLVMLTPQPNYPKGR